MRLFEVLSVTKRLMKDFERIKTFYPLMVIQMRFGITNKSIAELTKAGVDFFTTGNHVWDKREGIPLLDSRSTIIRPGNYPGDAPGRGAALVPGTDSRVAEER